jgi:Integrase core domain
MSKLMRLATPGLLQLINIPKTPGKEKSLDLLSGLLPIKGHSLTLLVVIDRLSGYTLVNAYRETPTASKILEFMKARRMDTFRPLPKGITTDRGPQFISSEWIDTAREIHITVRTETSSIPSVMDWPKEQYKCTAYASGELRR